MDTEESNLEVSYDSKASRGWLFLFLGLFLAVFFIHSIPATSGHPWILTHWALDYSAGFIPRGLVGTLHLAFFGKATPKNILWAYYFFFFMFGIFSVWWLWSTAKRHNFRPSIVLLSLFFILFVLPYHLTENMAGRFDLFTIILFLFSIWFLHTKHRILAFLPGVLGTAVHETYLVFFIPTCLIATLEITAEKRRLFDRILLPALIVFAPLAVYLAMLSQVHRVMPIEDFTAHVQSNSGFGIAPNMIVQEYQWSLGDHFNNSLNRAESRYVQFHILFSLVFLSPMLYFFFGFWKKTLTMPSRGFDRVLGVLKTLATMSPLALLFIGTDYWRWLMMSFSLSFFFLFYAEKTDKQVFTSFLDWIENHLQLTVFVVVISALAGPMRDVRSFDFIDKLYDIFKNAGWL